MNKTTYRLFHYFRDKFDLKCVFLDEGGTKVFKSFKLPHYFYAKSEEVCNKIIFENSHWTSEVQVLKDLGTMKEKRFYKISGSGSFKSVEKEYGNMVSETDVSDTLHFAMDNLFLVGKWYDITGDMPIPAPDLDNTQTLSYLTMDIETSHARLCFPDPTKDPIISIACLYTVEGRSTMWIGVNKNLMKGGVESFTTNPYGWRDIPVVVEYCQNESKLLSSAISFYRLSDPHVFLTFNGDGFDMPFVVTRCEILKVDFSDLKLQPGSNTLMQRSVHIDALYWVNRDSMLPNGKRGLKIVSEIKLGVPEAKRVDHNQMLELCQADPRTVIEYNASDVILTEKLCLDFVCLLNLTLGTEVPKPSDEISRSGSGSVSEHAIMLVYKKNGIKIEDKTPNRTSHIFQDVVSKTSTYAGGSVECSVMGVQCGKFPEEFEVDEEFIRALLPKLKSYIEDELQREGFDLTHIVDLEKVNEKVKQILKNLPRKRVTTWKVLHVDVRSMYPSAMLTDKIQPSGVFYEKHCDFCKPETWIWKGDVWNMTIAEYLVIFEKHKPDMEAIEEQCQLFLKRQKRRPMLFKNRTKTQHVFMCQKAQPVFYQTIKAFSLRREEFKLKKKKAQQAVAASQKGSAEYQRHLASMSYYDGVQLSFKTILNSVYGALAKKGNRMGANSEVAAAIITSMCRDIILFGVEQLDHFSKPLEHDTDGAWRKLPDFFPFEITFTTSAGKRVVLNLTNVILNGLTRHRFTNHMFVDEEGRCVPQTQIVFEPDPPYGGMYFPASDDGIVKKKYILMSSDYTSIKEIKGLERQGEINFYYSIKKLVTDNILPAIRQASTIADVYSYLLEKMQPLMRVLETHGQELDDEDFFNLFSQTKCLRREISTYKNLMPEVECVKRLINFLEDPSLRTRKNISVEFFYSLYPANDSRKTFRVIPTLIFQHPNKKKFLRELTGVNETSPVKLADWKMLTETASPILSRLFYDPRQHQCGVPNPFATNKGKKRKAATEESSCNLFDMNYFVREDEGAKAKRKEKMKSFLTMP